MPFPFFCFDSANIMSHLPDCQHVVIISLSVSQCMCAARSETIPIIFRGGIAVDILLSRRLMIVLGFRPESLALFYCEGFAQVITPITMLIYASEFTYFSLRCSTSLRNAIIAQDRAFGSGLVSRSSIR